MAKKERSLRLGWEHKLGKRDNGFRFHEGSGLNLSMLDVWWDRDEKG